MLDWNTPKLSDKEWIEKCVKESQYIGGSVYNEMKKVSGYLI